MSESDQWICCQLGAREHYSFPRNLYKSGRLALMLTDAWVPPNAPLSLLPIPRLKHLRERFHAELSGAPLKAFTSALILFEIAEKGKHLDAWSSNIRRNLWFQRRCLDYLKKHASQIERKHGKLTLFAYSYSGLSMLRFAKSRGWRTVMSQIDGGPGDEDIVMAAHAQHKALRSKWQPAPPEYWQNWREECNLADRIVVNSEWSQGLLCKTGVEAGKLRVIPVAYEAESPAREFIRIYPAEFTASRPLRVLFLGAFAIRKGAAAVLEAIALLKGKPVEFWIVGSVAVEVPSEFQSAPEVKWIGPVSRDTTANYYREADLFLFPTISDGFGMTQVEARGWKLPIIATPFCAPVAQNGINGLVLPEVSGHLLASVIQQLMSNPGRLALLAQGSPGEQSSYSNEAVRKKVLDLGEESNDQRCNKSQGNP